MKNKLTLVIAIAVALHSCNDHPDKGNLMQDTVPVDRESNDFVANAINDGMAESRLAKLAEQKAISKKVRDYAGMLVNDHGVLNDQLKAVSSGLHVVLPSSPGEAMQSKLQLLSRYAGQDFDQNFLDMMIRDHQNMIRLFEHASKMVNNAEVKTLVDNALPQLNKHLDSARALKRMYK
jgi:putative membrane protein